MKKLLLDGICPVPFCVIYSKSLVIYDFWVWHRFSWFFEIILDYWKKVSNSAQREINVHFGQFPSDDLERLTPQDAESAYQMAVKEADQIRAKSTNIAQFQQADWKRLWHSVVECDVSEWSQVGWYFKKIINNIFKLNLKQVNYKRPQKAISFQPSFISIAFTTNCR